MQDLIPTDSETTKEMLKTIGDYLEPITKTPKQELGGYFADKIRFWRASQQLKQLQKLNKKIKQAGFEPKKLDLKVLFPYLEGISLEEDEGMQDAWANLITNYLDPNENLILTVYPDILRQLSTPEVKALEFLDYLGSYLQIDDKEVVGTEIDSGVMFISKEIAFNLMRLDLVESKLVSKDFYDDGEEIRVFEITEFGTLFVKACKRP